MALHQYDTNDPYTQYNPNGPYSYEFVANDPAQSVSYEPFAAGTAQYAAEYIENEPFPSGYEQPPIEYYRSESIGGVSPGRSRTPSRTGSQDHDYYVSLEPCGRGSGHSMYDTCDPKCMIRLVGKGYDKEIELSLDGKMDNLVYRIFRVLEDEEIVLDAIRFTGLPKKTYLQSCLEALCAPFASFCSPSQARHPCFHNVPQRHCCTPSTCPNRRRSSLSARYSYDSARPRRSSRRSSSPCRMARVCQDANKNDCVLVKISPSLPKVGDVSDKRRSTGVSTDESPELEIVLKGCREKCVSQHRGCACPHCCSSGRRKVLKCRGRLRPKERHRKRTRSFGSRNLDEMSEEELVRMLEKLERERPQKGKPPYDPAVLDTMTEEELIQELERLERGEEQKRHGKRRASKHSRNLDEMSEAELVKMLEKLEKDRPQKGKPPYDPAVLDAMTEEELIKELERLERGSSKRRRTLANLVLVESPDGNGFSESGSCLLVPKKLNGRVETSDPNGFSRGFPLNVFSVHQTPHGLSDVPKKCPETALVLKEVLRIVKEILRARSNGSVEIAEEQPSSPVNQIKTIYCRSGIWLSESDSHASPNWLSPRNFRSSKSVNFVARLRSRYGSRRSCRKNRKAKFEPPSDDHQDGRDEKFEKLRIYVETDTKGESAEFVPVELVGKEGSMNLNTLIS